MANSKIMVVDDDANICELLRLYLEKEGFDPVIAPNGVKALELFDSEKPDLILLDVMMPQLDGWQVCREIRKKSQCPIIMLTAKGEVFDKVLGLELGADDYVVKPFEAKEVIARVKAVLRRSGVQNQKRRPLYQYGELRAAGTGQADRHPAEGDGADLSPRQQSQPGLYPGSAPRRGLGVRILRGQPDGGRACQASAGKARRGLRPMDAQNGLGRRV